MRDDNISDKSDFIDVCPTVGECLYMKSDIMRLILPFRSLV